MIRVSRKHDVVDFEGFTRPPSIYLDHCAIREISRNESRKRRLLSVFENSGTLLYSWAHVLDLLKTQGQEAADLMQEFFLELGPNWFPLEINPIRVIKREDSPSGNSSPCFGPGFLEAYAPHIYDGPLTLSKVVELTRTEEVRSRLDSCLPAVIQEFKSMVADNRSRWESDRQFRKQAFKSTFDNARPTAFVWDKMMLQVCKENFPMTDNHVVDFFHTIVPRACASLIVLDKHWADLARKMGKQDGLGKMYRVGDIDNFLSDFEEICGRLANTGLTDAVQRGE